MHKPSPMIIMHQPLAAFGWTLTQAATLAAGPQPRALWVLEGRVWITCGERGVVGEGPVGHAVILIGRAGRRCDRARRTAGSGR